MSHTDKEMNEFGDEKPIPSTVFVVVVSTAPTVRQDHKKKRIYNGQISQM